MADSDFDEMYKIVLVGDAAVGKSNLLAFYTSSAEGKAADPDGTVKSFKKSRKPTVGVEFAVAYVPHPNGSRIKAQIWDTAGQERYRAITASHYRRAAGALLVYDVTKRETFKNAKESWLKELQGAGGEDTLTDCTMLVGNKVDSAPVITEPEHTAAAKGLGLLQARTSAKTGEGVTEAFNELVIAVYNKDKAKAKSSGGGAKPVKVGGGAEKKKGGCC